MEKSQKLELLKRSLGLRHKMKVHDSMKTPDDHEGVALNTVTRWEFEDELNAIEEILAEERARIVREKKAALLKK